MSIFNTLHLNSKINTALFIHIKVGSYKDNRNEKFQELTISMVITLSLLNTWSDLEKLRILLMHKAEGSLNSGNAISSCFALVFLGEVKEEVTRVDVFTIK